MNGAEVGASMRIVHCRVCPRHSFPLGPNVGPWLTGHLDEGPYQDLERFPNLRGNLVSYPRPEAMSGTLLKKFLSVQEISRIIFYVHKMDTGRLGGKCSPEELRG